MKKQKLKQSLLIFVFLFLGRSADAQFNNEALFSSIRPADTLDKQLDLRFYTFNFVRNYEYANHFHDGYTLYGTQVVPQLIYYAHPRLAISAGAYLRKDFGREGIRDAQPLFNLTYHKNDLRLIFGSLEGNIQHQYIEPLYDFEGKITHPVEYGTQLLIEQEKLKLDAWIAWQKMIDKGEAQKEEIVGGLTAERLLWQQGRVQLSLPVQVLAYHQGGQIDVLKDVPISTLMNAALGFKLKRTGAGWAQSLFTENYFAFYNDFSPTKRRNWQRGYGLWLHAGAQGRWGTLMASYWKGHNFISIKGMPLYESVSHTLYNEGYTQSNRSILALRYAYQKELVPHLYLDVRFEPHIDFNDKAKDLQFNHSFFLTYKEDFKLLKRK